MATGSRSGARTRPLSGHPPPRDRDLGTPRLRVPRPGRPPAPGPCPPPSSPGSSRKPPSQPAATLRAQAMAPRPPARRGPAAAGALPGTSVGPQATPLRLPPAPSARSPRGPGLRGRPPAKCTEKPVLGHSVVPLTPPSPAPAAFILLLSFSEFLSLFLGGWMLRQCLSMEPRLARNSKRSSSASASPALGSSFSQYRLVLSVFSSTEALLLQSPVPQTKGDSEHPLSIVSKILVPLPTPRLWTRPICSLRGNLLLAQDC